jgi:hypothetical protein
MLGELNEIMAFKPWVLNSKHIEALTSNTDKKLKWATSEILLASSILANYHALCSLIIGNGIKDDIDTAVNFNKGHCNAISILASGSQSEVTNDEEKIVSFLQN